MKILTPEQLRAIKAHPRWRLLFGHRSPNKYERPHQGKKERAKHADRTDWLDVAA